MFDEDRIIKIACRFAVNGHDGQVAEVAARDDLASVEMGYGSRFFQNVFREDAREMVLANDHLDIDSEIFFVAEHFNHAAPRRAVLLGPVRDFYIDNQALKIIALIVADSRRGFFAQHAMRRGWRLGKLRAMGNEHRLGHALVEGHDIVALRTVASRVVKDANDRGIAADEDAGYATQSAAIASRRSPLDQYLITLHGSVHFVGRDEDVFLACALALVWTHKSKAVPMQIESSGDEVVARGGCFGDSPAVAFGFDEMAGGGEAGKMLLKQAALAASAE
jgi:hypothetical protein